MNKVILSYSNLLLAFLLALIPWSGFGQFAGPAGQNNSTAIAKDSSIIIAWANSCTVQRGYQNIADISLGTVTSGDESNAIGPADEISTLSLGDSGLAILTFGQPIFNGVGPDFVVFENAFNDNFLELAFVEVSSDGINYFRFPATSNTQSMVQIGPFDELGDATKLNNMAGKYRSGFGTPFDLQELSGNPSLDINAITHVKIVDVVGSINSLYGNQDQNGNYINDPFPTPFDGGGFDLDALGLIYQYGVNSLSEKTKDKFSIYPNPTNDFAQMDINLPDVKNILILDIFGKTSYIEVGKKLNLSDLVAGTYFIQIEWMDGSFSIERIIKQ
jgi:Secretion system C-terminal sorting domain